MGVAVNVTEVPLQITPLADEVIVAVSFTSVNIEIPGLTAVAVPGQASLLITLHLTTSVLLSVVVVYVLPVPALMPLTCHWYVGLTRSLKLLTFAVNVTGRPEQSVNVPGVMVTTGARPVLTVNVCDCELAALYKVLPAWLAVIVVVPADKIWTIPVFDTVATAGLLLMYVIAMPDGENPNPSS